MAWQRTAVKVDWDLPAMTGGMDEDGNVHNEQDLGSLSIAIPRVDLKIGKKKTVKAPGASGDPDNE